MQRTLLLHPCTQERCAPETSRLRGGRADGMRAAASSKLVSGCRWKRGEPRRGFCPRADNEKRGVQKTDPKIAPLQRCTPGVRSENGLLFFRCTPILRTGYLFSDIVAGDAAKLPSHSRKHHWRRSESRHTFAAIDVHAEYVSRSDLRREAARGGGKTSACTARC